MSISLRNLTIYMFRTIYERSDKYNKLKPYFYRIIIVQTLNFVFLFLYNNALIFHHISSPLLP